MKVMHVPDIAWIIALYKAIHGGDPGPSDRLIASQILAESLAYLTGQATSQVSVGELAGHFERLGLKFEVSEAEAPREQPMELRRTGPDYKYMNLCWGSGANRHCVLVQVPSVNFIGEAAA